MTPVRLIIGPRALTQPEVAHVDRVHVSAEEKGAERVVVMHVVLERAWDIHFDLPLQHPATLHAELAFFLVDDAAQSLSSVELFAALQVLNLLLLDRILPLLLLLLVILAFLA